MAYIWRLKGMLQFWGWICYPCSPPIGGMTWSSSFILVRFQIFLIIARNSSLACSKLPGQEE